MRKYEEMGRLEQIFFLFGQSQLDHLDFVHVLLLEMNDEQLKKVRDDLEDRICQELSKQRMKEIR
jgi:hypothetical protein